MNREVILLVVGAGIALASSLITALVQHALYLRADRVKRARDEDQRRAETMKDLLKKRATDTPDEESVLRAWSRQHPEQQSLEARVSELLSGSETAGEASSES